MSLFDRGAAEAAARTAWRGDRVFQWAWLAIALLSVVMLLAGLPVVYRSMGAVCETLPAQCGNQLTAPQIAGLADSGISLQAYIRVGLGIDLLVAATYLAAGALVAWRRPDERMARFVAIMLVTFGVDTLPGIVGQVARSGTTWYLPAAALAATGQVTIVLFCYTFPDGRFRPSWTRLLFAIWSVVIVLATFFSGSFLDLNRVAPTASGILFLALIVSAFVAQIYRYRRLATPAQRQQTKWIVYGLSVGLGGFFLFVIPYLFDVYAGWVLVASQLSTLFLILIPVSIAAAIMRSRLWDIDLIIRRTLVYGMLMGTLTLVYFGSVVLLQQVLRWLLGHGQPQVVVVVSTLVIGTLFTPLRRRIQERVARRFYRRRYNAAQTLAAFGEAVRDEVDLSCLAEELVSVVRETMQPEHVSLWLKRGA